MKMTDHFHAKPAKIISDLRELVDTSADSFGDKILYRYREENEWKTFSYNDLKNCTDRFGTALASLGLGGARVALIGENHPLYITAYLATVNLGSVIIPLDRELAPEQIVGFCRMAGVQALLYTDSFRQKIPELATLLGDVRYFIAIRDDGDLPADSRFLSFASLLKLGDEKMRQGDRSYLDHTIDPEQLCSILFTSGTTGTSKGVMLCQRNLTAAVNAACQATPYDDRNRFVSVLPPHHTYEMTCGELGVINIGAEILINDSIRHVMKNFSTYKPDALILVPLFVETMHKKIWDEIRKQGMETKVRLLFRANALAGRVGLDLRKKVFSRIRAAFGGNLTSIVCGGAPLDPEIVADFYRFGITVFEGYGITECAPLIAVNRAGRVRLRSVGLPVLGCHVRIDADEDAGNGTVTGEILAKGDNVMLGYYEDEAATAAVMTEDGYFRTGDIGYLDRDGYVYITGRKKNVIILSNGKNVFPEELEEYLGRIPFISEAVVVGRPSEKSPRAEIAITAIVVPDMSHPALVGKSPEETFTLVHEAIMAVNKKLPSFKHMTALELRYIPFEKNSSQKIKRYKIK